MKRTFVYTIALTVALSVIASAAKTKYKVFAPHGVNNSVFIKAGEKKHKYFIAEQGKELSFEVTGPTRLKIRTRAEFAQSKSGGYEIQIWKKNKLASGKKVESSRSDLTIEGANVAVGVARDIFLKVPSGKHKYTIRLLSGDSEKFYLRFYQAKPVRKKSSYASVRPTEFKNKVELKSKKSNIAYYLVDNDGGVKLKVIGPTKVRIYCRVNFDPTMKEKSKFGLGVFENGKSAQNYSGITNKVSGLAYVDHAGLVPSKLKKYTFDVPSGEHVYEFKKLNSAAPSLSIRFKMPKSNLGKKN